MASNISRRPATRRSSQSLAEPQPSTSRSGITLNTRSRTAKAGTGTTIVSVASQRKTPPSQPSTISKRKKSVSSDVVEDVTITYDRPAKIRKVEESGKTKRNGNAIVFTPSKMVTRRQTLNKGSGIVHDIETDPPVSSMSESKGKESSLVKKDDGMLSRSEEDCDSQEVSLAAHPPPSQSPDKTVPHDDNPDKEVKALSMFDEEGGTITENLPMQENFINSEHLAENLFVNVESGIVEGTDLSEVDSATSEQLPWEGTLGIDDAESSDLKELSEAITDPINITPAVDTDIDIQRDDMETEKTQTAWKETEKVQTAWEYSGISEEYPEETESQSSKASEKTTSSRKQRKTHLLPISSFRRKMRVSDAFEVFGSVRVELNMKAFEDFEQATQEEMFADLASRAGLELTNKGHTWTLEGTWQAMSIARGWLAQKVDDNKAIAKLATKKKAGRPKSVVSSEPIGDGGVKVSLPPGAQLSIGKDGQLLVSPSNAKINIDHCSLKNQTKCPSPPNKGENQPTIGSEFSIKGSRRVCVLKKNRQEGNADVNISPDSKEPPSDEVENLGVETPPLDHNDVDNDDTNSSITSTKDQNTKESDKKDEKGDVKSEDGNEESSSPQTPIIKGFNRRSYMVKKPQMATLSCEICGYQTSVEGLRHHKRRHHTQTKFTCDVCGKEFGVQADLNQHKKHHFDKTTGKQKPYPRKIGHKRNPLRILAAAIRHDCEICKRSFKRECDLKQHMKTHRERPVLKCDSCDYSTKEKFNLNDHKARMHGERNHVCRVCGKRYGVEGDLKRHMVVAHTNEKECVCHLCGKSFQEFRYLNAHLQRHMGVKRHFCDICNKGFFERIKMQEHKVVHMKEEDRERNFTCSHCQKSFYTKAYLKDHENIHTGLRPYKCCECNKTFSMASALHKHMIYHRDEKKHQCTLCDKSFKLKSKLNYHMVVHTKVSKHKCEKCQKVFTQNATLKRHKCMLGKRPTVRVPVLNTEVALDYNSMSEQGQSLLILTDQTGMAQIEGTVMTQEVEQEAVKEEAKDDDEQRDLYMCSICDQIFLDWDTIQVHMLEHTSEVDPMDHQGALADVQGVMQVEEPAADENPQFIQNIQATVDPAQAVYQVIHGEGVVQLEEPKVGIITHQRVAQSVANYTELTFEVTDEEAAANTLADLSAGAPGQLGITLD